MSEARTLARFLLAVPLAVAACVGQGAPPSQPSAASIARTGQPTAPAASAAGKGAGMHWIVSQHAVSLLGGAGMTRSQLGTLFGGPPAYLTGTKGAAPGWQSTLTDGFTSYATMKAVIGSGRLPGGVRAVLYDNEDWPLTPAAEQRHPAYYEALSGNLAHAHHLLFISTPATDLTRVLAPHDSDRYAAYLQLQLAASAARRADVIDIQAQGSEADPSTFTAFVHAAAAQARRANPHVIVLAGISTGPSGQDVTAAQVTTAVKTTMDTVSGYWLNIPGASTSCPRCGTPKPQVAVPLLRWLLSLNSAAS